MQFREHPGVQGKRDYYPFDPRQLKIDPSFNVRDLHSADLKTKNLELKESIRANGVRVPLEIRFDGTDAYVTSGHRRHAMVLELIAEGVEIKSVPVMPEPKGTGPEDRDLNLIISNSGEPLTPLEKAKVIKRLVDYGWEDADIAKRVGWKSRASVQQHLDMLTLPRDVQDAVKRGDVSVTMARRLEAENPGRAAKIIKDAQDEQRRLGKKGKATPKAVSKVNPKPPTKANPPASAPQPQTLSPSPEAAAFSNGHAATSEYTQPLPTAEVAQPEPQAAELEPPPSPSPAEPVEDWTAAQALAAGMDAIPRPLTHLTNGAFFQAVEPIALLIEDFDLAAFSDEESLGVSIPVTVAKQFLSAMNKARGVS